MPRLEHALVVGKQDGRKIIALRDHALQNPVPFEQVKARRTLHNVVTLLNPLGVSTIGDASAIDLPVGYRMNYEVEEVAPGVLVRHLTVSGPLDVPHPEAVAFLMWMLHFRNSIDGCMVYTEPALPTPHAPERVAVNVVEPLEGLVDDMVMALVDTLEAGQPMPNAPSTDRTQ
jgi:hypothetical protein